MADYFYCKDVTNHTQDLNSNPELIDNQNSLWIITYSPTKKVHHIAHKISRKNQQCCSNGNIVTQDLIIQISTTTFLIKQKNDPDNMKIIDSITWLLKTLIPNLRIA